MRYNETSNQRNDQNLIWTEQPSQRFSQQMLGTYAKPTIDPQVEDNLSEASSELLLCQMKLGGVYVQVQN